MNRWTAAGAGVVAGLVFSGAVAAWLLRPSPPSLELAFQLEQAGAVPEARATYEGVVAAEPLSEKAAEARRRLAALAEADGDLDAARREVDALVASSRAVPTDRLLWARLLLATREPARAAEALASVAEAGDAPPDVRRDAALRLLTLGHAADARRALGALLETPLRREALAELVILDASLGDFAAADTHLALATAEWPDAPSTLAALCHRARAAGDLGTADTACRAALASDALHLQASLGLAAILAHNHRGAEADAALTRASAGHPAEVRLLWAVAGRQIDQAGRGSAADAARAACAAVNAAEPGHPLGIDCESRLAARLGDRGRAVSLARAAVAAAPDLPGLVLHLIHAEGAVGEPRKAREAAEAFLARFPQQPDVGVALARLQRAAGDEAAAAATLDAVLAALPAYPPALLAQADQALAAEETAVAERLYQQVGRLDPGGTAAPYGLVEVYLARDQASRARAELARILEIDAGEARAHMRLAAIEAVEGHPELALNHLELALARGVSPEELAGDPSFESMADDPGFQRLLASPR